MRSSLKPVMASRDRQPTKDAMIPMGSGSVFTKYSEGDAEAPLQFLNPLSAPHSPAPQVTLSGFLKKLPSPPALAPVPVLPRHPPSSGLCILTVQKPSVAQKTVFRRQGQGRKSRQVSNILVGGRGQRGYHLLVIFVQTQLSPSFFSSLPQCSPVSLSPLWFSPRLCCFFCFPVSVSHCLSVCLSVPLPLWSAVSSSRGRELRRQGKSPGQRTEGHGFWQQPTEISPLSFPPPQYAFQDEQDKPLPVPSNQCCKYFSVPSWAPVETLILPPPHDCPL